MGCGISKACYFTNIETKSDDSNALGMKQNVFHSHLSPSQNTVPPNPSFSKIRRLWNPDKYFGEGFSSSLLQKIEKAKEDNLPVFVALELQLPQAYDLTEMQQVDLTNEEYKLHKWIFKKGYNTEFIGQEEDYYDSTARILPPRMLLRVEPSPQAKYALASITRKRLN
ncbi:MAG: hypothetical protein ACI9S8_003287 [Chlamydiales bacterium]|jgi:hypothetical protein